MNISVCLATYNGEKYLKEQVDSILMQLSFEDELIISDDYSEDNTLKILKEYNDPRIKIFLNTNRKGVVGNFENAILKSSGDIVFLCDQDDIWLPNKVTVSLKALENNDLIVTNCVVVNEYEEIIFPSYFKYANSKAGFMRNLFRSSYLGCCLAFNRRILNQILPFPRSLLLFHDWWFGFLAEVLFKVEFIDVVCLQYRRHELTSSKTVSKSSNSFIQKIYFRVQLLFLGALRYLKIKFNL